MPPYHTGGWLTEVSPAERESIWWSGLSILTQVHALDVADLGLDFVDQVSYGPTGLRQRLAYYEHYLEWAYDGTVPVAQAALAWLHKHRPAEASDPVLLWGDSRIGNIIFRAAAQPQCWTWRWRRLASPRMTWPGSCCWIATTARAAAWPGCRASPNRRKPSTDTCSSPAGRRPTWTTTKCCRP
jgi:hypothetical protein